MEPALKFLPVVLLAQGSTEAIADPTPAKGDDPHSQTTSPTGKTITSVAISVPGYAPNFDASSALPPVDPSPAWLVISVVILILSFFLLKQAVEFQKWASADDENAPDPSAGFDLATFTSISIVAVWIIGPALVSGIEPDLNYFIGRKGEIVKALLLASLLPAAFACYKFWVARSIGRAAHNDNATGASFAGVLIGTINFAGSIATLVGYWRQFGMN